MVMGGSAAAGGVAGGAEATVAAAWVVVRVVQEAGVTVAEGVADSAAVEATSVALRVVPPVVYVEVAEVVMATVVARVAAEAV